MAVSIAQISTKNTWLKGRTDALVLEGRRGEPPDKAVILAKLVEFALVNVNVLTVALVGNEDAGDGLGVAEHHLAVEILLPLWEGW